MDTQYLINEVAKRHNIVLGLNDPVLVTTTLNELIVTGYLEKMQTMLNIAQDNMSGVLAEQLADSKETASKVITNTSLYISENIKKAFSEIKDDMMSSLQQELALAKELQNQTRKASQYAFYAAGVAIITVVILGGAMLTIAFL